MVGASQGAGGRRELFGSRDGLRCGAPPRPGSYAALRLAQAREGRDAALRTCAGRGVERTCGSGRAPANTATAGFDGQIELELEGVRVRVGRGAEAETVAAVIQALKAA